jgi:hypothetical protein
MAIGIKIDQFPFWLNSHGLKMLMLLIILMATWLENDHISLMVLMAMWLKN